jgi:hypothetical protein
MVQKISRKVKIGFGAGEFSSSIFFTVTSFWLLNFLTDEVRLAHQAYSLLRARYGMRNRSADRDVRPHARRWGAGAIFSSFHSICIAV